MGCGFFFDNVRRVAVNLTGLHEKGGVRGEKKKRGKKEQGEGVGGGGEWRKEGRGDE